MNSSFPISGTLIEKSSLRMHWQCAVLSESRTGIPVNENIHLYMSENREI